MQGALFGEYCPKQWSTKIGIKPHAGFHKSIQTIFTLNGNESPKALARKGLLSISNWVGYRVFFFPLKPLQERVSANNQKATPEFWLENNDQPDQSGCQYIIKNFSKNG
jgi:hypothetical protein